MNQLFSWKVKAFVRIFQHVYVGIELFKFTFLPALLFLQTPFYSFRIDENMEDTLANVEGAQGQLVRYLNSISSNRWLMIKIFFVLVVFLMIFLFFVA